MSDIVKIVEELDSKIKKLVDRTDALEKTNQSLRLEVSFYQQRFQQTQQDMEQLHDQIETLKTANALLGSDDFKRETKIKINSIIREIDYCVAQLSD